MASSLGRAPSSFQVSEDTNQAEEFALWLEDFEAYLDLQKIDAAAQKRKLLLNIGGIDLRRITKGLVVTTAEAEGDVPPDTYTPLKTALEKYFKPSINLTAERHRFRGRKQRNGETVTAYLSALRAMAQQCSFDSTDVDTIVNGVIRDQFIEGLQSSAIRRELLATADLTLTAASAKAVGMEASILDSLLYEQPVAPTPQPLSSSSTPMVNRVMSGEESRKVAGASAQPPRHKRRKGACKYCGGEHTPGRSFCPAGRTRCRHCGIVGHFPQVCLRKDRLSNKIEEDTLVVEDEFEEAYTMEPAATLRAAHDPRYWVDVRVDGKIVHGLLDTGATRTIMPCTVVQPEELPDRRLRGYGGQEVHTLGTATATFEANGRSIACRCFVVSPGKCPLFGQDVIQQLQLVTVTVDEPDINTVTMPPVDIADINTVTMRPVDIAVDPNAVPVASACRRHAFSIREEVKAELSRMLEAGIIEPVKEATPWISPIVPSRKSNGKLRLCIDYRKLNQNIIREKRAMPTAEEITAQIHGATIFSVLDAESGFHQIPLSSSSQPYTTFTTEEGLFRFKRLPFGISCAPEIFQRVMSDLLAGIPGVFVYVDDVLVTGDSIKQHDERLQRVLERLQAAQLKLNNDKCQWKQSEVRYLGSILNAQGVNPDPDKVKAILDMPLPESQSDVRRFLGMLTYLGKFIPGLADATAPVRTLAKREPFVADNSLWMEFNTLKEEAASRLLRLSFFDVTPTRETAISVDASPCGLGAILWQKDNHGRFQPVSCASRALKDPETRYSQLEREMLAVVFGLVKFRQFVLGRQVIVFTDHKPLVAIVKKEFDQVPARVQRWLLAILPYDFQLTYTPGTSMICTDALSRAPSQAVEASPAEARSMKEYVGLILGEAPISCEDVRLATDTDGQLSRVRNRVLQGKWNTCDGSDEVYFRIRDSLSVVDDIVMHNNRIVIPGTLYDQVLRIAHEGHPGLDTFLDTLRQSVWWPSMSKDASEFARTCSTCWKRQRNPPQPLQPSEILPVWYRVAVDLVEIEDHHFLSVIDYGSRYPELLLLSSTTSRVIIQALSEVFARHGLPVELVSDNGPQLVSDETETFLRKAGVKHIKSSPRYPCSNGMVERFHGVVRRRLSGMPSSLPLRQRLQQALFGIRTSVNRMIGTSPGEAFFGRALRGRLPNLANGQIINREKQIDQKMRMAHQHDQKRGVRELPALEPGSKVVLQDGYSQPAKEWCVVRQEGRQVVVEDGVRTAIRNRRQVRE
eukprot:scpid26178/ scgid22563/ Retrovirus-related Pol polyprotein from transposon opus; Protease; Reverse transcriptase; Endonuclease